MVSNNISISRNSCVSIEKSTTDKGSKNYKINLSLAPLCKAIGNVAKKVFSCLSSAFKTCFCLKRKGAQNNSTTDNSRLDETRTLNTTSASVSQIVQRAIDTPPSNISLRSERTIARTDMSEELAPLFEEIENHVDDGAIELYSDNSETHSSNEEERSNIYSDDSDSIISGEESSFDDITSVSYEESSSTEGPSTYIGGTTESELSFMDEDQISELV